MNMADAVSPEWIADLRTRLGMTQSQFAERLGVTNVTVSRWETGQARPNKLARKTLAALAQTCRGSATSRAAAVRDPGGVCVSRPAPLAVDFQSDGEAVRLFVEGERLRCGHLFSPVFATETAVIDPLPHQIVAVYDRMLPQPRLRFLLADDAGAGKTIMAGLYIREMLSRRLIGRVLVVSPAGLVGNWKSEMSKLFSLRLREVTGADCQTDNPFAGPDSNLAIVSIDTLSGDRAFARLAEASTSPYDLVIFDEAHKLSASRNTDLSYETTDRYKLAEMLAGADPLQETNPPRSLSWHARHLLLLTATPHMGKDFPYYALWRLLEPMVFRTWEAFITLPMSVRKPFFLRRSKEEMVNFDGSRMFKPRVSETLSYDLNDLESQLYEDLTTYVRTHYNRARILNRSAARLAMSVLQRRAASSTWAILRSLDRRLHRLDDHIARIMGNELTDQEFQDQQRRMRLADIEDEKTGDEEEGEGGFEERDWTEEEAMGATAASTVAELQAERAEVESIRLLARRVYDAGEETKFEKLSQVIADPRFRDEKLLIFTEHRDTLDFLVSQLEGMGYAGQVASIHGGMPYEDREAQMEDFRKRCRFMVATDAAGEGINLQFCWILVNYDIPWNPARIEQRFGRIHRYKQKHDPVVLVNLVANRTREGVVISTLLTKLEMIRKEMGSDKVFDVIGRQFLGMSLRDIIMEAVVGDDADDASRQLEGRLTAEQIRAIAEADATLRATGGDVALRLPDLIARRDKDLLRRLLPASVCRFVEMSAPRLGASIRGDVADRFWLERLPMGLALAMEEATEGRLIPLTANKPSPDDEVLFLRPGEPFFDFYRDYFCERESAAALRGAAFVDPYAREPYFYHLARVAVLRRADPAYPESFAADQVLDSRLVALKQTLDGHLAQDTPGLLMVLRPLQRAPVDDLPSHSQIDGAVNRARAYLEDEVVRPLARERRMQMSATVAERGTFLKKGFDFQEAELLEARARLREQAGDPSARSRLEEIRTRQKDLKAREERALAILMREAELVEAGEVDFLAHALVLPSSDPGEKDRHDREVELIAMQVARGYEESFTADVDDVSVPGRAVLAGLEQWPGFDLLSRRPGGERRCIEVKGRRRGGEVEVKDNEWVKAAILRGDYWLYVVYDCATPNPRLIRIQDPLSNLLVRDRGGVIIGEAAILGAAQPDEGVQ